MKTCAFIIIPSVAILLCFQKVYLSYKKGLELGSVIITLKKILGLCVRQMAFLFIGEKRSSLDENKLFCVDSGLCYEMTQSEQGAFHGDTIRITHSSLSMNALSPENFHFCISFLKTHFSLWPFICHSVLFPVSE